MTGITVSNPPSTRNLICIITDAAREAIARIAQAMKTIRLAFRASRKTHITALVAIDPEAEARHNAQNDIQRRQHEMMQQTGEANPIRAHRILMQQYLAGRA